jgi:NADH-quinone oxidoreductase subunit E
MLEIATEITVCLLIAAMIGFAIGYIVAKSSTENPSHTAKEESDEEEVSEAIKIPDTATKEAIEALEVLEAQEQEDIKVEEEKAIRPEVLTLPLDTPQDILSTIKGIGPKLEEKLNTEGVFYFYQIANWSDANIKWLEINTTFAHRAKKDLWVNQAKALLK